MGTLDAAAEKDLVAAAIDLAHIFGWRVAHFRPARTSKGWRTAVQADGKGFPDLLLIRGNELKIREVKTSKGKPTPEQVEWMAAFRAVGIDTGIWTPGDIPEGIVEELKRK